MDNEPLTQLSQLKISDIRSQAEKAIGSTFDIPIIVVAHGLGNVWLQIKHLKQTKETKLASSIYFFGAVIGISLAPVQLKVITGRGNGS